MKHVVISDDNYINNKNIVINSDIVISKNDWKINFSSELKIETVNFNNLLFNKDQKNWNLQTKSTGEISEIIKNTLKNFNIYLKITNYRE